MRLSRAHIAPLALVIGTLIVAAGCSPDNEVAQEAENVATHNGVVADAGNGDGLDATAVRGTPQKESSSEFGANSTVTAPPVPSPPTLSGGAANQPTLAAPSTAPAPTPAPTTTAAPTTASSVLDVTVSSTAATETIAPPASTTIVVVDDAVLTAGEAYSATLLAELRTGLALSELSRQAEMDQFARDWSRQMAESGTLVHSNGPYGENIAYTTNTDLSASEAADVFHQLWVDSPGHYRNMTNETYVTSGIGLYKTENGWYGTHVFGF